MPALISISFSRKGTSIGEGTAAFSETPRHFIVSTPDSAASHARNLHAHQLALQHAAASHLLEHLLHLSVLTQQLVHFLNARTRPACDALPPAAIDDFVTVAFPRSHGIDDG